MDTTLVFETRLPVTGEYDVVVCGGGPAGVPAALAARRAGLSVLLVEGEGQLGGMATSGMVAHWLGGRSSDGERWVIGGIFRELSEEATEQGAALLPGPAPEGHHSPHGWLKGGTQLSAGVPLDPFAMAAFLDAKMEADGVEVLLKTRAIDVRLSGDRIEYVILHNKSGLHAVRAGYVIDATGDADIAAKSGCETVYGDDEGLAAAVTLEMLVDHVDTERLAAYVDANDAFRFLSEIEKWQNDGSWPFEFNRFITVQLTEPDTYMVNTSRIMGIDGTDGASVSRAMVRGRRESRELIGVCRKLIPGYENARIKAVASLLGVRETRRIVGGFVLKVSDLAEGTEFPDVIGYSAYGWDLPDPGNANVHSIHRRGTRIKGRLTGIPYRVMLPRPVSNLICPGRSISVEREVLGPTRVMGPCMAMGEAAGTAAALAAGNGVPFAEVDHGNLRDRLAGNGAIVDVAR